MKFKSFPAHTGPLLVRLVIAGGVFTVTASAPDTAEQPAAEVMVTEYDPEAVTLSVSLVLPVGDQPKLYPV